MDPLVIAETAETPDVILGKGQGKFQITGKSLIENAGAFYKPVAEWLASYAKAPNPETNLSFKFEYLNIESSNLKERLVSGLG
ncbi:MAG TPA: SiaC family regulatory phosphoprotein, partial [Cyclobacteriaceae bacterium]|nr:SiaC family regulatory phosphoprotein [Cyclobacteriaceae bacterium]